MEQDNKVSTHISQKNLEPISFFEKDADFVFVYKKTERLASAVYMVTSLFSENESMKWSLRKRVSELLSFTVTYKDTSESTRLDFVNSAKTKILELVSLLEVSLHGGLISKMNFSILKQEFSNVLEALQNPSSTSKDVFNNSITEGFFDVPKDYPATFSSGHTIMPNYALSELSVSTKKTISNEIKDKEHLISKDQLKKSNRQNIILGLLRKKKELTIKDIAQVIKDCSEKTIQRELNSFIATGTIKRTGVRRWSKYSLALR